MTYSPPFNSFDDWLSSQATTLKQKPAIVFDDFVSKRQITISYRQLNDWTAKLANLFLSEWGLKPKDKVALAFPNSPEIILINYAAWRAGLVTVPLDVSRDTLERKKYKLQFTNTKLLLAATDHALKLKGVKTISFTSWQEFKNLFSVGEAASLPYTNPDSDALILFTSGTTALPKGARLSLTNLWANAESIVDWLRFEESDRWQVVLPLHHINSTTFVNTALLVGATVILLPQYSKSRFWQLAARNKISGTSLVPTIAYDLLSEEVSFGKVKAELKNLRRIQLGSAPVQPTVVETFMKKFSIPLVQGYGQTETSLRSTGVPMNLTPTQFAKIRRLNSLGTKLKYTEIAILDKKGKQLSAGKVGDICVRGPVVMAGYLKNKAANEEAFAFDWFHSGDTGYWQGLFGRKFFFLKGRSHEIIKKGGILISPLAIENALLKTFPQLKQVYAVGFPDARLGEEIGVVSLTEPPANLNVKFPLKPFELPRAWIKIEENELPKTSTGKVQRVKIKEMFGVLLLQQSRTIAQTDKYVFRLLGPEETKALEQALAINNQRWGKGLTSTLEEFKKRATFGLLLAAIDRKSGQVVGSVSIVRLNQNDLPDTWGETTHGGTLENHDHKGDSLVCVAISVRSTRLSDTPRSAGRPKLTPSKLKTYLQGLQDSVVRFHRNAKGGLAQGGRLIKVLPLGRPEDKNSLGYNILFAYPQLTKKPVLNPQSSLGVQLIEAALIYAYQQRIKKVLAYSRPAELGLFFRND